MAWKQIALGLVGGLVVLSMGWNTAGQEPLRLPSVPGEPSAPAATASGWRAAGSGRASKDAALPIPAPQTAALQAAAPQATAPQAAAGKPGETVTERYPNGKLKLQRHVTQDAEGNYVNHGPYALYDADGKLIKAGAFRLGKLQGEWFQHFERDEGRLFSTESDREFVGPFLSEATFEDGQLHGTWRITARAGQQIVAWNFVHGVRDGTSTWWHGNGKKRAEATYKNGKLQGDVLHWDRNGKPAGRATHVDGRSLTKKTQWYAPGRKHYEGYYLQAQSAAEPEFDWWAGTATAATAPDVGQLQKHGQWTAWYANGNMQVEGYYDHDLPSGRFTWWYEDGQKQAEGQYRTGMKTGTWSTWHANGMKQSTTQYQEDALVGKWMHWNAEGKLVEIRDFQADPGPALKKKPAIVSQRPARDVQLR